MFETPVLTDRNMTVLWIFTYNCQKLIFLSQYFSLSQFSSSFSGICVKVNEGVANLGYADICFTIDGFLVFLVFLDLALYTLPYRIGRIARIKVFR